MTNQSSIKYISGLLENPGSFSEGDQSSIALFRQTFPYFVPMRYLSALETHKKSQFSPSMMSQVLPYLGNWILFCDFLQDGRRKNIQEPGTSIKESIEEKQAAKSAPPAGKKDLSETAPALAEKLADKPGHISEIIEEATTTGRHAIIKNEPQRQPAESPSPAYIEQPIKPHAQQLQDEIIGKPEIIPVPLPMKQSEINPVAPVEARAGQKKDEIIASEEIKGTPPPQPAAPMAAPAKENTPLPQTGKELPGLQAAPENVIINNEVATPAVKENVEKGKKAIQFAPAKVIIEQEKETPPTPPQNESSSYSIENDINIVLGYQPAFKPEPEINVPGSEADKDSGEIATPQPDNETEHIPAPEDTIATELYDARIINTYDREAKKEAPEQKIAESKPEEDVAGNDDADEGLLIMPVYTEDYFLQQGVVISAELPEEMIEANEKEREDKSLMVMMSFSEWLLHFKSTSRKQKEEKKDQKSLKTLWQKEKLAAAMEEENEEIPENVFEMAVNSIAKEDGLASESLADIYIKQGKYDKAIEMYRKLSLRNPKKSAYFARKIEEVLKEKQS